MQTQPFTKTDYARQQNQATRRDGALQRRISEGAAVFLCWQESRPGQARDERHQDAPKLEHYPEHDHAADNEEELYIPLEGSGILHAQGQSYPIERGVFVRVGAATKRRIVPGPEGMTLLMLSDRPDPK